MLVGAGSAAGAGLTARALAAIGGEERHLLVNSEMPVHAHGGATGGGTSGNTDTNHYHAFNVNSGTDSPDHAHYESAVWQFTYSGGGVTSNGVIANYGGSNIPTSGATARHAHNVAGNTNWQSDQYATNNHSHSIPALGIANDGGGVAHNVMPPWCAVALIVKVLGVQIDPGGAIRGATGQRGAIWYMYNGGGTPATGTFVGELDGDFAIRKVDGENFQRQGGVWVDLGFTNRSTAATTAARAYLGTAFSTPANAWTKIPIDTVASGMDPAGLWDPTNHRFVAKSAGFYQVNGCVQWGTSTWTGFCESGIYKNGVNVARGAGVYQTDDVGVRGRPVSDVVYLNIGDYVEIWGYSYVAFGLYLGDPANSTYLSVALITAGPGPQGPQGIPSAAVANACRMHRQAAFTSSGGWFKVPLDTIDLDTAGMASAANGRIVIPTDGVYHVSGNILINASATGTYTLVAIGFWVNGVQLCQEYTTPAIQSYASASISDTYRLKAGDYIELYAICSQATTFWDGSASNYLTVTQLTSGPGPRTNWFSYGGAGTPAAGTFPLEGDSDMAIRTSDSEVFRRVSGAWTDQGYKAGGTLASTPVVAKARRGSALSLAAGWTKVPMDTMMFDSVGSIVQTANGRLVAPYTGYYQVSAQAGEFANSELLVLIATNGAVDSVTSMRGTRTANTSYNNGVASGLMSLNAGDFIEMYVYTGVATTLTCNPPDMSWMSLAMVQPGAGPAGPIGPPGSLGVQPAAMVQRTTSQALPVAPTLIIFDTAAWSQGGMTLDASGCFKCPSAGIYLVTANLLWDAGSGTGRGDIALVNYTQQGLAGGDGSTAQGGGQIHQQTNGQYYSSNMSAMQKANANDLLGVVAYARTAAATLYGIPGNWSSAECCRMST